MSSVTLVTASPRNPSSGSVTTLRFAGGGNLKPYYYASNHYRAGISSALRINASFGFDESGPTGGVIPQTGTITLAPASKADLATWAGSYWPNADITVQEGDEATAVFTTRLTGKVADAIVQDHRLVITIADQAVGLDRPVVTARFAGTGGAEGGTEAKNRIKRRTWGRAFNIEGRVLDKANNIYEFGDLSYPWQEFTTVRDKGRDASPAPTVIAWAGSISATLTALIASTPASGSCTVAPSIACVKWYTQPAGPLTADVKGEIGAGYVETVPDIAARILTALSGPTITNTSAMATLRPGPAGIHIDENENINSALNRLLMPSFVLWVLNPAGTITLREITFSSPVEALTAGNAERERTFAPMKTRRVGYQRAYRVHNDGEIAASLTSQITGRLTKPAYVVATAADGSGAVFTSAGGTFNVLEDNADVTTSATFSVASSSGVTMSINSTTGVYAPTAMSADNGIATLRATYGGISIDQVYSIAKSKAGQAGANGTDSWTPNLTGMARTGSSFTSTVTDGTAGTYISRCYSSETAPGMSLSLKVSANTQGFIMGLDTNGPGFTNFTDVERFAYFGIGAEAGNVYVYAGSTRVNGGVAVSTYSASDLYTIEHQSTRVVLLKNGVEVWPLANTQTGWTDLTDTTAMAAVFAFDSAGTADNVTVTRRGYSGQTIAEITCYQRSATTPSTPTGGSYDFATKVLTPPSGWTTTAPTGTNPLYQAKGTAFIGGATGTATPTWLGVGKIAQDGAAGAAGSAGTPGAAGADGAGVDVIFIRSATTPSTPAPSTGTPSGWYTDAASVPASSNPMWASFGQRPNSTSNYTWDTAVRAEGAPGAAGATGATGATGNTLVRAYRRGLVAPSTPTGNSTPSGWSAAPVARSADFVAISSTGILANADYTAFTKTAATFSTWDESFRSTTAAVGMAVRFRPMQTDKLLMIGLNTDPATDNSYTSIDHAVHCAVGGTLYAFGSGTNLGSIGTYTADDIIAVEHRGTTVVITKNGGSALYTWTGVSATTALYADSSFGDGGGGVTNVAADNGQLWMSEALQDIAGVTSGSWSTPVMADGEDGTDGNWRDVKYQRSYAQPTTPTGDNPAGWSDGVPDGTATLWTVVAQKSFAGALIGVWSTPKSISGVTPRGSYSSSTTYYSNNLVTYNGGTYAAVQDGFSNHPPTGTAQANAYWDVFSGPGPAGTPAVPPSAFSATINLTSGAAVNLRSVADANGYTGASDATITFNVPSGVTIRGLTGSGIGIDSGSWPSGYAISLAMVVQSGGVVDGGGGNGGAGGESGFGSAGSDGGDAIFCRVPMTVTVNSGGTLRGGGGGGSGGDALARSIGGDVLYKGGSGGGGGFPNGLGGSKGRGDLSSGNDGAAGTTSGGGAGGAAVSGAGAGYAGGGAGSIAPASGGAGGYAVRKNGNTVTVTNNGLMNGTAA